MKLKYLIAARYVRSPKSHSVINLISLVSVVAMAVPVAAIILLLSIFNGLEQMTDELYQSIDADLRVTPARGTTLSVAEIDTTRLRNVEGIECFSLVLEQSALAEANQRQTITRVRGVDNAFSDVITIKDKLHAGSFTTALDEQDCIVAAHGVAHDLAMLNKNSIGMPISLYAINRKRFSSVLPVGGYTRCELPMIGLFSIDQESSHILFTSLRAAQHLFGYPNQISSVDIKLSTNADVDAIKSKIKDICQADVNVKTRYESNSIYRLMALEKWGVFVIAMVVMAVASLSIVGTLVMVVIDKRDDISTLRTLGASQSLVESIFLSEGYLMALLSLGIGVGLGVTLSLIQQYMGVIRLNAETLMIDAYPVELHLSDVILTILAYMAIAWSIIRLTIRKTLKQK